MIVQVIAFVVGTVVTSRIPLLLPLEPCLMLAPLLGYGLRVPRVSAICALLLGAFWCFCALKTEVQNRESLDETGEVQSLVGVVRGMPVIGEHSVRFVFQLEGTRTRVRLYWYQTEIAVEPGQRWRFQVRLKEPTGAVNFKTFDYERWLFSKRIHALGHVVPNANHHLLDTDSGVDRVRHHLKQYLERVIPDSTLPTFLALSIGDTSQLRPADWQILNHTGTTHLLIVSGLHVGLIATLVFFLCRAFGVSQPAAALATAISAILYALIAGWGLPVQRALIMTLVYLGCGMLNRNISLMSRLALAAMFVLIFDPLASLSTGFWLSFGVVTALILGLSNRGPVRKTDGIWGAQWVAFLSLLPLLAGFNHQLPLVSLGVNLIAIPIVGFILVPLILMSLVAAALFAPLADMLIIVSQWVTIGLWRFLELASSSGGLIHITAPERWQIVLALLGATVILTPPGLLPRWTGIPLMLVLLAPAEPLKAGSLRLTFFDVGQGMSVLIESASGATLYDTGPDFPGSFNAADQIVLPAVRSRGWDGLDQFIISHTDNDHAGGKEAVLATLPVHRLIEQGECHAEWERDRLWFFSFDVAGSGSRNDSSCLLLVVVGKQRILLTGDIESAGEYALLKKFRLPVDLVSVPHHGSDSSSSPAFINTLIPQIAVISAGYRNRFGHPHEHIVDRYETRSVRLLQTANSGAIEIMLNPDGMMVRQARSEPSGIWRRRDN